MTRIKMCGLMRPEDIQAANEVQPDLIGFIFVPESRRYIPRTAAGRLAGLLDRHIQTVGVFSDAEPALIASFADAGIIDMAQLHGHEDETYLVRLRQMTQIPVMQAFRVRTRGDLQAAGASGADMILLDAGAGSGEVFDWEILEGFQRPYFLAGGLHPGNAASAVRRLRPYGLDVSSGIETEGKKDPEKMAAFAAAVRKERE